jgi:hypothetical protein
MRSMNNSRPIMLSGRLAVALLAMTVAGAGCGSSTTTPKAEAGAPKESGVGGSSGTFNLEGGTTIPPDGAPSADALVNTGDTAAGDAPTGDAPGLAGDGATAGPDAAAKGDAPAVADAPPVNLCGNGVKDPGEACDITAKDEASRCPDL